MVPLDPVSPVPLALAPDEVHVWCLFVEHFTDAAVDARLAAVMTPDERVRQQRFVRATDRHLQLLARALVRILLSSYTGLAPDSWRFDAGPHGKPFLVSPVPSRPISFNLSHTAGLVAAAFTVGADVGVDVEHLGRQAATTDLARRFFAPAEVAAFERTPLDRRQEMFFAFWTVKEAYLKARGLGLSVPLAGFSVDPVADPVTIAFAPPIEDRPSRWQFARHAPGPGHRLAVAVERREGRDRRIRVGQVAPPPGPLR